MIKVENIDVWGFEHAIRGMRNPMNSWDKSDSGEKYWCTDLGPDEEPHYCNNCNYDMCHPYYGDPVYVVGQNDLELMKKLYKAGSPHRKFMRQIFISLDITAPLYWWKEFDTYKVGTVSNSCSTMHKIHDKEFTLDDFSHEHLFGDFEPIERRKQEILDPELLFLSESRLSIRSDTILMVLIELLNFYRQKYLETKDKKYWWQLIQLLPSSYNQKRTITMDYENAINIIYQRAGHKLDEWREFIDILGKLPYLNEIVEEV